MNFEDMTPAERLSIVLKAMQNPCKEGEHVYEDRVDILGEGVMLGQLCRQCFDIRGWFYTKDK